MKAAFVIGIGAGLCIVAFGAAKAMGAAAAADALGMAAWALMALSLIGAVIDCRREAGGSGRGKKTGDKRAGYGGRASKTHP